MFQPLSWQFMLVGCISLADAAFRKLPGTSSDGSLPSMNNESQIWHPRSPVKDTKPAWAAPFTMSEEGCPCWFDLSLDIQCACCEENGIQCGNPMHMYCQKKTSPSEQKGCPGIPHNEYTLSTKGHPCGAKRDSRECAWCTMDGFQCQSKTSMYDDSVCVSPMNLWKNKCVAMPQDCNLASQSACSSDAECISTDIEVPFNSWFNHSISKCACKNGFIGNGIDCFDEATGSVAHSGIEVNVKVFLVSELEKTPNDIETSSSPLDDLLDGVENMLDAGNNDACTCDQDIVSCGG